MCAWFFNLWLFSTPYFISPWLKIYQHWPLGIFSLILFASAFLLYAFKDKFRFFWLELKQDFLRPPLCFLLLMWLIYIVSLIFNYYRIPLQSGLEDAAGFKKPLIYNLVMIGFFAFSILSLWLVGKLAKKESLSWWVWAAVLPVGWGFFQVLFFDPFPHLWWENFRRLHAFAGEAQVFGNYLLSVIFLAAFVPTRRWNFALVVFLLAGLFLTWSLGAWVGGVVGVGYIFFWLWVKRRRVVGKFWLRLWLVVGLALAVLFIFNFKYTRDGFYTISYKFLPYRQLEVENGRVYATQFSQEDRRWLREVAWKMFEENPVLGVGPGNFGLLHNQYVREEKMKRPYLAKAHNAYLEILAEAGLLGLIAFLAFLVSLFGLSLKNLSQIKKDEQFYLILALQASLIAIIIQGFGFGILAHSYTWILFGFLYGEVRTER